MSDRGLPLVDGAQACPFVAFENERDERATSPDHRHRCYAEERPAPRALAHQEAYCLSSSFPVCPTFQDWASREAAHARAASGGGEPSGRDEEARRNPPQDWPASPSWGAGAAAGAGAATAGAGMYDDEDRDDESAPGFPASRSAAAGAGLAGSAADRLAAGPARGEGDVAADAHRYGPADEPDQRHAARLDAIGEDDMADERGDDRYGAPLDEDELESERPGRPRSARASGGIGFGRDRRPKVGDTRRARGWDEAGPSWEQPRHNEPYPALRSRGPRVPRVAAMAIVIVVAAIGLFFLPQLLGIGAPPPATGDRTSAPPGVSTEPSVPLDPTAAPGATPQLYTVKSGDSMFSIAEAFGITPDELIAANRETHPNPDQLQIGDQLIIPTPAPGGSAPPSPSVAP